MTLVHLDGINYRQWYRDQGRGQEAADALSAEQSMDGTWPIARIYIETNIQDDEVWSQLLKDYGINAMGYHIPPK